MPASGLAKKAIIECIKLGRANLFVMSLHSHIFSLGKRNRNMGCVIATVDVDRLELVTLKCQVSFLRFCFYIINVSFLSYALCAEGSSSLQTPDDFVSFFKQAVKSPPDVAFFQAKKHDFFPPKLPPGLLPAGVKVGPPIELFEGGRSSSNFFYGNAVTSQSSDTDAIFRVIAGREGTNIYEFSGNSLSYGIGNNAVRDNVNFAFSSVSYLLNLGIGDIVPESVTWTGNHFSAKSIDGSTRYGELTLSNGFPRTLMISLAKGSSPLHASEYTYPDPPDALSGFPSTIRLSVWDGENLIPNVQIEFSSVRLAPGPLPDSFFDASNFTRSNITFTNVYSNATLLVRVTQGPNTGTIVRVPLLSNMRDLSVTETRQHIMFYVMLAIFIAGPVIVWLAIKKTNNKTKQR